MVILGDFDPPTAATLQGHVDVYCLHGRTIARKWPTPTYHPPSAGQRLARENMKMAMLWAWGANPFLV